MSKVKEIKSYICPSCGEKQDTVIQWQTVSIAYVFDFETRESEEVDREGGEHESWTCPDCGEDLPTDISEKISQTIFC